MKRNIRKISFLTAILVLVLSLLTGCSKGNETASAGKDSDADDKTYNLKLATVVSAPHPWIDMAEYFSEEVEKRTDGKVKIAVHDSGTLGKDETTIDEMRNGTIDIVLGGTQNVAAFVPEYQVFGLSYLFDDVEQFERIIGKDSPVFQRFKELYDEKDIGLKLLALSYGGVRNASNNKKPIETPDDLKAMKMRLPGSPMESKLWSELGAIPTSLSWNELYSAIQTGVVNTFESTVSGYKGAKLYEVAPYHSQTEHLYMVSHVTMSKLTYDKLPEEYVKIIEEVAIEASEVGSKSAKESEGEMLKELQDEFGVKVNEVDKKAFAEKVKPLYEELAEDVGGAEILKMINDMK